MKFNLIMLGVGLVLLTGSFWVYGQQKYREGKQDLLADIEKARVESVQEKEKIDAEIENLDNDELLQRALGFVRNPSSG